MRVPFLLALTVILAAFAPAPAVRVETAAVSPDSFAVVVYFRQIADGQGPITSLSVTTTCLPGGTCPTQTHTLTGGVLVDSALQVKPAPGATKTGKVFWQASRAGTPPSALDSTTWSFTNTATGPVIVADSVRSR